MAKTVMVYFDTGQKTVGRFDFLIYRPIFPFMTNIKLLCQERAVTAVAHEKIVVKYHPVDNWYLDSWDTSTLLFVKGLSYIHPLSTQESYLKGIYGLGMNLGEITCGYDIQLRTIDDISLFVEVQDTDDSTYASLPPASYP